MLCQAPTIQGGITADYIKKQLYKDKQQSIPAASLEICAKSVNGLKTLVPKTDAPFQALQWFPIRQLRNSVVKFAGNKTKLNELAMKPDKEATTWDYDAIRVDPSTLYYLYEKDHNMTREDGTTLFTSGASIKTTKDKQALFDNFLKGITICTIFKMTYLKLSSLFKLKRYLMNTGQQYLFLNSKYLIKIFQQQKLEFQFKFLFSHQYDLQFLGSGGSSKAQMQLQQSVPTKLGAATDKDKEQAGTLADQLKATKAELASVSKKLKVLEAQRRQAARLSRAYEKDHHSINRELYGRLKDIRHQCNDLYLDQQRLHHSKSQDQSHLYMLNKKIRGQAVVAPKPAPAPPSFGPKTKIQGVDPGVVTMASGICSDQKKLFESINRYAALQDSQETVHHGMDQDVPFKMTANVVNAAVSTKTSPTNSPKKKQKKRIKSKCRLRRFYGKHCSHHRKEMGSKSFITFTGIINCIFF